MRKLISLTALVCLLLGISLAGGNVVEKKWAVVLQSTEVRSGPSLKFPVLYTASPGEKFQVLGEAGGWVKVRLSDGREGYIWGSYLRVEVERVEVPAPKQPPAGLKPPPPSGSAPVVSKRPSLLPLYIAAGAAVAGGVGYFLFRKGGPLNRGKATLRISSSPSEAVVYIDGQEKCETPCTVEGISPGTHTVKVERELYGKWEKEMEFEGYEEYQVEAELSPFAYEPDFCFGSRGSGDGQFHYPWDLTLDDDGNIYVADFNNHRLQKFDPSGNFLSKLNTTTSGGIFLYPSGIRYSPHNRRHYVVFSNNSALNWYSLSLSWLGNSSLGLHWPRSMGVDSSGNVYIADGGNARIVKTDENGNLITTWTVERAGSFPMDAEPGQDGKVYVSACGIDKVIVYTSSGNKEMEFSTVMDCPAGISIDRMGHVYVVSNGEDKIYKFLPDGTYVLNFGEYGNGRGQFYAPYGIAVDDEGKIYVADEGNDRICIWRITGRTITSPTAKITVRRKKEGTFRPRGRKIQGLSSAYGLRKPLRRIKK